MQVDDIINSILVAEGGYVNDSLDAGGETNYGITATVAKANGYYGNMKDLPRATAIQIYKNRYWFEPKFDKVAMLSPDIAAELCDTGVNAGTAFARGILQSALNLLNRQGKDFADLKEDGNIGPSTLSALGSFLLKRGKEGECVLLKLLNVMQGAHYIEISKARVQNEDFLFGWLKNRVNL